jgi:hypothetical protein
LGLSRYRESITYFDLALAVNPEFQEAQIYKGMALYFSGQHDEAFGHRDLPKGVCSKGRAWPSFIRISPRFWWAWPPAGWPPLPLSRDSLKKRG